MSETCYLGVDIGTYSSKGVLIRASGEIIASHSIPHSLNMPHPGHFEQDADAIWWGNFVRISRSLLEKSGVNPRSISGVGVSGIGPCVLPVDEQGNPLRPGILYGIDTRAEEEIRYLEGALGREHIFNRTAMHLSSQAAGPKILWIRNHEPEVFQRARWFLTSQAYLVFKLTGLPSIDVYTAGYYAPLFDVFQRCWIAEWAESILPLDRLPPVYWTSEVVGAVTAGAARQTGLAEGTPVVTGTADAAAEALSAGMRDFGDLFLMFGSSLFFILKTAELHRTERFWSSNFLQSGEYAVAGGMSTAGSLTVWFREQLAQAEVALEMAGGSNAFALLAEAAAGSPPGARGLVCLPYFEGERTPLHDPKARGAWFGLSLKHTRADIYRAILEGVAFGIRHNLEVMAQEDLSPGQILVSGGGAQNRTWLQIVADVCGVDLALPNQLAGASFGDAFLASIGGGLHTSLAEIERWAYPVELVRRNSKNYSLYQPYYQVFRDLYPNTKALMHQLADLSAGGNDHE